MFGSTKARRLPRGRAIALVVAAMALFAAVATTSASAATYTSLGDSYAAGPLIPNQSLNPLGCLRSDHNYAHLTAAVKGLTLTDVSCSGATTNDMTETQNVEPGPNPPQFNGLNAGTNIVSLTIGGNDIGFTEIIESCITYNPFSTPCKDKYDPGGNDQLAERIANAAPKVAAVLQGIHSRSPNARVFVVNYPDILPSGSGCWPTIPLSFGDVPYLHATEERLNSMLATTAAANGATIVNWYSASIGHDACKGSSTRWVEPLIPGELSAPVHPNKAGMAGGAVALEAAIG
ncbi:MAG TPA: SGNH/GDSL hydrolase family protein [Solirubrobacterales bacterium]|nr:SGNH/GDSL hydrolase family protein [Solirubrobacterales bacterium]